jgi:hypothetical protein
MTQSPIRWRTAPILADVGSKINRGPRCSPARAGPERQSGSWRLPVGVVVVLLASREGVELSRARNRRHPVVTHGAVRLDHGTWEIWLDEIPDADREERRRVSLHRPIHRGTTGRTKVELKTDVGTRDADTVEFQTVEGPGLTADLDDLFRSELRVHSKHAARPPLAGITMAHQDDERLPLNRDLEASARALSRS